MSRSMWIESRGSGPAVCFLHGLDSDSDVWTAVVDMLPDHRCVTIDLPGHGRAPTPTDPQAYARPSVLTGLDTVLADIGEPTVLVGHSLGGYLAMAHAITRPGLLAGLVLVATGPGFRDGDAREEWNDRVRNNARDYGVDEIAATIALHVDSLVIDQMPELTLPIRLVIGDQDRAYLGANDYMERKLRNVERTTVTGGRHYVMKSHPEAVAAAVRSLTGHREAPTPP
ncbi:MAG: alpha/beta fold hydrolase [Acidimicrobiales bacterium]